MFKPLSVIVVVLVAAFASISAQASDARISCIINKSQTIEIYPSQESVKLVHFLKGAEEVELSEFNVYRCPYCFSFKGVLNGQELSGSVRSVYSEKTFVPYLTYARDGKEMPEGVCSVEDISVAN